jgi:hypothetical protein
MAATITRRLVSLADAARRVRRLDADGPPVHRRRTARGRAPRRKTLHIKIDPIERFIDARPVGKWR